MNAYSDEELRAIYRKLIHTASNKEEAAQLLAACSILAKRGYHLNEDESDWIKISPIGE